MDGTLIWGVAVRLSTWRSKVWAVVAGIHEKMVRGFRLKLRRCDDRGFGGKLERWENETNVLQVLRRTDTAKLLWLGVEKSLATDAQ